MRNVMICVYQHRGGWSVRGEFPPPYGKHNRRLDLPCTKGWKVFSRKQDAVAVARAWAASLRKAGTIVAPV